jgi:hypothetical protein
MRLALCLLLLFSVSAHGRLPDPRSSPPQNPAGGRPLPIPGFSSDCDPQKMKRDYFNGYHARKLGTCGAMEKIWKEGLDAMQKVSATRMDGLLLVEMENRDDCQSDRRRRLYNSGLESVDMVDRRVQSEAKRIMEKCEEDRELYKRVEEHFRNNCRVAHSAEGLRAGEAGRRDIDRLLKEAEKHKEKYETRRDRYKMEFLAGREAADGCAGSLGSISTSTITSIATETATGVGPPLPRPRPNTSAVPMPPRRPTTPSVPLPPRRPASGTATFTSTVTSTHTGTSR